MTLFKIATNTCGVVVFQILLTIMASPLHAQSLSRHGIPTSPMISATEQEDIDEDIAHHLGDVPVDPGPKAKLNPSMEPAAIHAAIRKVADWELERSQPYFNQNWNWSVLYAGFMAASRALDQPKYRDAMLALAERFDWKLGAEDPIGRGWPSNNDQALAQSYLELYMLSPAPEKLKPTQEAFNTLLAAKPLPKGQIVSSWEWCDALFMGPASWARLSYVTHDPRYLDYLEKRWWETSDAFFDSQYHLCYRDKTWIGRKSSAGKPIFWARGNGWAIGGLARTLEYLPKDYPGRGRFEEQLRQMAAELASIQDPNDGLWHADLLDAADYPQPEISGSSLITLGLASGVNQGVLDRATYGPIIAKAWRGMVNEIYADGRLGNIQQTGGAPSHYMPASSFHYGIGGFLLAGEQVAKLAERGDE